jgi:HEAT repeat protein
MQDAAIEPLIDALKSADFEARKAVIFGLEDIKDRRVVEALEAMLTDSNDEVRRTAEKALKKVKR